MSKPRFNRRGALRAAAVGSAAGGLGLVSSAGAAPAKALARVLGPLRVIKKLQLVDGARKQRFLLQSTKPPVYLNGVTYPPEQRSGPPNGSYFIFNDENQSERGGITVSPEAAQISFDWPTIDAVHLNAISYPGALGAALLSMRQMPDPSIPPEDLTPEDAPPRVLLGTSNAGDGAVLALYDSLGRPRIQLQVDGTDVPRIQILDEDGQVVAQLPPEEPGADRAEAGELSTLLQPPASRLWTFSR
ncbi:MAG TPA: hypothetical protein VFO49_11665 [Nocardioides sp.]|nr:hypothetical protein [Nocardioides sp.]